MMDNPLAECELITFLKIHADAELSGPENIRLEEAYTRFVEQVVELSERNLSSVDFLRYLTVTKTSLEKMKLNFKPAIHKMQLFFIDAEIKYLK